MGPELVERRAVKSARVGEQLDRRLPEEREKKKTGRQTTDVPTKAKTRHQVS